MLYIYVCVCVCVGVCVYIYIYIYNPSTGKHVIFIPCIMYIDDQ